MLSYLLVACLALMAGTTVAQTTPGCVSDPNDQFCSETQLTTKTGATVQLSFLYEPKSFGSNEGIVCSIQGFTVNKGPAQLVGVPDTVNANNGAVTVSDADSQNTQVVTVSLNPVTIVKTAGSNKVIGTATLVGDITTAGGSTLTVYDTNNKKTYSTTLSAALVRGCGPPTAFGDPHFSGFLGQQFSLEGEGGLTYNILSAANMQLNSRLVQLNAGDALTRGEMRTARLKSLFALPNTYWFDHAGPYMGELGVAMLNGHQLYAKAGAYESGFASVQLDGVDMAVSASAVVLGEGASAITVTRVSAYQLSLESADVKLTFTNSDHFFNIENAQLQDGFSFQKSPLAGALGQSANAAWVAHDKEAAWRKQVEKDALVESNDLFALNTPAGTVSA